MTLESMNLSGNTSENWGSPMFFVSGRSSMDVFVESKKKKREQDKMKKMDKEFHKLKNDKNECENTMWNGK